MESKNNLRAQFKQCSIELIFPVGILWQMYSNGSSSLFWNLSSQALRKSGRGSNRQITSKVPISFVCSGHSGYHYHVNGIFLNFYLQVLLYAHCNLILKEGGRNAPSFLSFPRAQLLWQMCWAHGFIGYHESYALDLFTLIPLILWSLFL